MRIKKKDSIKRLIESSIDIVVTDLDAYSAYFMASACERSLHEYLSKKGIKSFRQINIDKRYLLKEDQELHENLKKEGVDIDNVSEFISKYDKLYNFPKHADGRNKQNLDDSEEEFEDYYADLRIIGAVADYEKAFGEPSEKMKEFTLATLATFKGFIIGNKDWFDSELRTSNIKKVKEVIYGRKKVA